MLKIPTKLKNAIDHYKNGLITKAELYGLAWGEFLCTVDFLPNGKTLIECRRSGLKNTI